MNCYDYGCLPLSRLADLLDPMYHCNSHIITPALKNSI